MKLLESQVYLASCFPSIITAGVTYKSFFTPAYSKATSKAFKRQLVTKLQMHWHITLQLLTQVHGIRVLSHETEANARIHVHDDTEIQRRLESEYNVTCYRKADGHYTLQKNFCLGILVADCAGVLLYDVHTGYSAALHSGWKGTAGNIVGACIEDAQKKKIADPSSLIAWISPCARACCYEVGHEVAEHFVRNYPQACHYNAETKKYMLDIARVITMQLETSGLMSHNIHAAPLCSICSEYFHSHRRESTRSGRCLVFIMRTAA